MNYELKPAEKAEKMLIHSIMVGEYTIDSNLPAERQLATTLGVTRPTLREALQRMARDGWLDIQQGKPTRVKDFLREGSLGVLQALILSGEELPEEFVSQVLLVRALLAPSYARLAVKYTPDVVIEYVETLMSLDDEANTYAEADGKLHKLLADCSGNFIFSLIMNGFMPLYPEMGRVYFTSSEARRYSDQFYVQFLELTKKKDLDGVSKLVEDVMQNAIDFWRKSK